MDPVITHGFACGVFILYKGKGLLNQDDIGFWSSKRVTKPAIIGPMIWMFRNNIFARNKRLVCSKHMLKNSRTCWLPILSIGNIRTQRSGGQQTSAPLFFRFFGILPLAGAATTQQVRMLPSTERKKTTVLHDQPLQFWKKHPRQTKKWMAQHHRSSQIWVLTDSKSLGVICDLCNCIQIKWPAVLRISYQGGGDFCSWRTKGGTHREFWIQFLKAKCLLAHLEISETYWNPPGHHDC